MPNSQTSNLIDYLKDRTVLITGAAGTIGSALAAKVLAVAKSVRCFDHSETELFFLHQRLKAKGTMAPQLGDVRDMERLRFAMSGVDVVFHTAALKHVGLAEYNPFEVVQTNLQGLNNIIRAALDSNVERVVFTSSDKAVNPTNVMGASKMMGERLITAANEIRGNRRTTFSAVRFGNVIGSRGSVVPIFVRQLLQGEPLTLTSEHMTRYVMTVDEAAGLVIEAGHRMLGGEVFVTKMRALRVLDLAGAMADLLSNGQFDLTTTGPLPGEKLYEELLADEETERAVDLERLLVVLPSSEAAPSARDPRGAYGKAKRVDKSWNSSKDTLMTRAQIVQYLKDHQVLEPLTRPGGSS
jgi:UDP-N-acetylglucosamine 4,6-dehydratase